MFRIDIVFFFCENALHIFFIFADREADEPVSFKSFVHPLTLSLFTVVLSVVQNHSFWRVTHAYSRWMHQWFFSSSLAPIQWRPNKWKGSSVNNWTTHTSFSNWHIPFFSFSFSIRSSDIVSISTRFQFYA